MPHNAYPCVNVPLCFIRVNRWHFKFRLSCARDRIMTQWGERGRKRKVSIIYGGLGLIVEAWERMRKGDVCAGAWRLSLPPIKEWSMATEDFHPIGKCKVVSFGAEKCARDLSSESVSIKVGEGLCLRSPQPVSAWFSQSCFLCLFLFPALVNQMLSCFIWYDAKWLLNLPNTIISTDSLLNVKQIWSVGLPGSYMQPYFTTAQDAVRCYGSSLVRTHFLGASSVNIVCEILQNKFRLT